MKDYHDTGLVAFIDILGTKEGSFIDLYKIMKIFHHEMISKNGKKTVCKKYTTSFSDCAYIIYTCVDINDSSFNIYLNDSLYDLSSLVAIINSNGYLCRGGITYDKYYFEENNRLIFGPAVNRAYELENKAVMPRIIIDEKIADNYFINENKLISDDFLKLIRKDEYDNRFFLNYLYYLPFFEEDRYEDICKEKIIIENNEYTFEEFFNVLEKYSNDTIEKELKKEEKINYSIIAKHKWQLNYLNQHKEELKGFFLE